jgi:hypothetical protein
MRFPSPRSLLATSLVLFIGFVVGAVTWHGSAPVPTSTDTSGGSTPGTTAATPGPAPIATPEALSATLAWTTAAPTRGLVQWGPAGMRALLWSREETPTTNHRVRLTGLAPNTTYEARVVAGGAGSVRMTTQPLPGEVVGTLRNGVVHVNGEPFFPLIVWQECPDRWPSDLRSGINLFAGNPCTGLANLLTAVAGRALVAGSSDDIAGTVGPGLLGWFYADEADARGLTGPGLIPLGAGLRFLTLTSHFFSRAAPLPNGRAMYPGLVEKADVVGFDLYPLQELCRPELLPWVYDAQRALRQVAPGRATFQWIEVRELKCPQPAAAVTAATIRVESWLAIAGGATGLAYFPPNWVPGIASVIRGLADRIDQLRPALLTAPVRVTVAPAAPSVRASARRFGGALYLIAANAGTSAARVILATPELDGRVVLDAGGDARLSAVAGRLTVTLPPRTVRILVAPPAP